jgi:small-conductance mechanosensitive channel
MNWKHYFTIALSLSTKGGLTSRSKLPTHWARFTGICMIASFLGLTASGYTASPETSLPNTQPPSPVMVPVTLDGKELFRVQSFKASTPEERAMAITRRIKKLAEDLTVHSEAVTTDDTDISTDVVVEGQIILAVTDKDAAFEGRARVDLAKDYANRIKIAIEKYRHDYSRKSILRGTAYALLTTIVVIPLLIIILKAFRKLFCFVEIKCRTERHSIRIKTFEVLQSRQVKLLSHGILKFIRLVVILVVVYVYVELLLSYFPWTNSIASQLLSYLLVPLEVIASHLIKEIPNLIFITILALITRFFLKFMHIFFKQIEVGKIFIEGFYPEWAKPTDRLLTMLVIAFAVMAAFPYIPGSQSAAFKGISIFIGILVSIGSQSAVSNIIAGMVMAYRRAFRIGDHVQIGDVTGDVTEIGLQVTHLRTAKNELVILPNSTILNGHISNYSSLAQNAGLILHTNITIGYDTPWRQVHALLLLAAEKTSGVLKEPSPFVLQKSLDDFYVTYELNAYTNNPHNMRHTYSELHKNIQDAFNEFGVQIMSPNYEADRPGPTLVPKERWYAAPAKPPGTEKEP